MQRHHRHRLSAAAKRATFFDRLATSRARVPIADRTYKRDSRGRFGSGSGGVRDALANAETIEEIGDAATAEARAITGRDIAFDMGGDPQVAREHCEGVLRGLERYPKTPLVRVKQGGNKYAEDEEAWASTSPDGRTISFTDDAQRYGAESYRADLKQSQAEGHLAVGTPMGVAMHEFGHSAANSYRLNGWANNKAGEYAEISMGTRDRDSAISRAISRRAAENDHELSAEAFSDVMAHGDRASGMSKLIVDTFDRQIHMADAPDEDLTDRAVVGFFARVVQSRERLRNHPGYANRSTSTFHLRVQQFRNRTYKRDSRGRFGSGGGVRDSLASATSIDELAAAAAGEARRITGRDIPVDMTGSDLGIAKEQLEGVLQGLERFPAASLVAVYSYGPGSAKSSLGDEIAREHPDASAVTQGFGVMENGKFVMKSNIYFNTASASDPAGYRELQTKAHDDGFLITRSPTGTGLHEMGHVLTNQLGTKRAAYDRAVDLSDQAGATPRSHITRNVSGYASSDMTEFSAEAFADVMTNGSEASAVSHAAFDVVESAYSAATGG